jgi:hypothetical protein
MAQGNWTSYVQAFVKDKAVANYVITGTDPAVGCLKDFTATYQCGTSPTVKTITIPGEAGGQTATFDCTAENQACAGFKLTLGDDGNLVLTNMAGTQLWTSHTTKTGLAMDQYKATNSKYGRNYLMGGETLRLGEFIGSPSGNCYLIMATGPDGGNGLQLNYTVANCNAQNFGNDEQTNGLFSLTASAYNQLMTAQNKVKPNMAALSETRPTQDTLFRTKTKDMNNTVQVYMGMRWARPLVEKHINQLTAMDEDAGLYLVRYKYRRIMWFALAVVVLLGGIKMAKKSSEE